MLVISRSRANLSAESVRSAAESLWLVANHEQSDGRFLSRPQAICRWLVPRGASFEMTIQRRAHGSCHDFPRPSHPLDTQPGRSWFCVRRGLDVSKLRESLRWIDGFRDGVPFGGKVPTSLFPGIPVVMRG
jgi:hypothetical protein